MNIGLHIMLSLRQVRVSHLGLVLPHLLGPQVEEAHVVVGYSFDTILVVVGHTVCPCALPLGFPCNGE